MTSSNDPDAVPAEADADARIDALARSTGRELRRPAPHQGASAVRRARRTQQVTRAVIGSTAALAMVAVGALALQRRADRTVPAVGDPGATVEEQDSTVTPPATLPIPPTPTATSTVATTASPPAGTGSVSDDAPNAEAAGGEAPIVFVSSKLYPETLVDVETMLNPTTLEAVGTQTVDGTVSRDAWNSLRAANPEWDFIVEVGGITYSIDPGHEEAGTYLVPDDGVDACGQVRPKVTGAEGSALPEWVFNLGVSADGRYLVTESAVCPESGTFQQSDFETVGTSILTKVPFDTTIQVFDAQHPELPGRILSTKGPARPGVPSYPDFSGNGRFVALGSQWAGLQDVFDLETGQRIEVAGGCVIDVNSDALRKLGTMIGDSFVAFVSRCPDGDEVVIRDLTPGGAEVRVPFGNPDAGFVNLEVAVDGFTDPTDAWFTVCIGFAEPNCFVGHGDAPLKVLPGAAVASFVPLGFTLGG